MRILLSFLFVCFFLFGFGQTIARKASTGSHHYAWLGFLSEKKISRFSPSGSPISLIDFLEADLEEAFQESENNRETVREPSSQGFYYLKPYTFHYSLDFLGCKTNRLSGSPAIFLLGCVDPLYRKNRTLLI